MFERFNSLPEMSKAVIVSSVSWVMVLWLLSPFIDSPVKTLEKKAEPVVHLGSVYVADLSHSRANAFVKN